MAETATAQQVAEAVRDAMWKDDHASQALGMEIIVPENVPARK